MFWIGSPWESRLVHSGRSTSSQLQGFPGIFGSCYFLNACAVPVLLFRRHVVASPQANPKSGKPRCAPGPSVFGVLHRGLDVVKSLRRAYAIIVVVI